MDLAWWSYFFENSLRLYLGLLVVAAAILLLFVPRWWMMLNYPRLLPGPFIWPIVGCLLALDPAKGYLVLQKMAAKYEGIFRQEIEKHRNTLNPDEPRDYIDRLLIKMASNTADSTFTLECLRENAKVLLEAGSDTSRIAISWFLLLMAAYPHFQSRAQTEIDAILEPDQEPSIQDREKLPFTHAAILESMRYNSSQSLRE